MGIPAHSTLEATIFLVLLRSVEHRLPRGWERPRDVPSSTLESLWKEHIKEYTERPWEREVRTYQCLTYGDNMQGYMGVNSPKFHRLRRVLHPADEHPHPV